MKVNKFIIGIVLMIIGFLLPVILIKIKNNPYELLPNYFLYISFIIIFIGLALIIFSFVSKKK